MQQAEVAKLMRLRALRLAKQAEDEKAAARKPKGVARSRRPGTAA